MRAPPPWLGRALALAGALALARAWQLAAPLPLAPRDAPAALCCLAFVALCGRVLLAWLPPGRVGGHAPAELATTWAASHLLGALALGLVERVAPALAAPRGALALALFLALLAALRLATRPAAMVPRRAVAHERSGRGARTLGLVVRLGALLVAVAIASAAEPAAPAPPAAPSLGAACAALGLAPPASFAAWLGAAHYLALVPLLQEGLRASRIAPAGRVAALGLCLLAPALAALAPDGLALALGLTAGAGFAVGWLRRASLRSLALSAAGWSLALQAGGLVPGVAGALATLAASARPSRARAALWTLVALALGWLARPPGPALGTVAAAPDAAALLAPFALERYGLAHAAALVALVAAWLPLLPRRARVSPDLLPDAARTGAGSREAMAPAADALAAEAPIDPPREVALLGATLLAAGLVPAVLCADAAARAALLAASLPAAALLAASVLERSERAPPRAPD